MRKFYLKEIPDTPVIVNGASMRFDVLATEDPTLIAELDKCIEKSIGGVIAITEEVYNEEVKKKESGTHSGSNLKRRHQRQELSAIQLVELRAAVAASGKGQFASPQIPSGRNHTPNNRPGLPGTRGGPTPDPIEVPTAESFAEAFSKPPTASMKSIKSVAA